MTCYEVIQQGLPFICEGTVYRIQPDNRTCGGRYVMLKWVQEKLQWEEFGTVDKPDLHDMVVNTHYRASRHSQILLRYEDLRLAGEAIPDPLPEKRSGMTWQEIVQECKPFRWSDNNYRLQHSDTNGKYGYVLQRQTPAGWTEAGTVECPDMVCMIVKGVNPGYSLARYGGIIVYYANLEPANDDLPAPSPGERVSELTTQEPKYLQGKEAEDALDAIQRAINGGPVHKVEIELPSDGPYPDANGWYSVEQALPSPGTPWLIFSRPHEEQAVGTLLSAEAQKSAWTDCIVAAFEVGEGSESFVFYATHWRCMVPDPE